jgi:hypothetical protein
MDPEILKTALAPGRDCLPLDELGRYADGSLDPAGRAAAAAHIGSCVNCQAELALMQALTSRGVQPHEAAIVRDGVARLERRSFGRAPATRAPRKLWLPQPAPRLAAVVALVLLTIVASRLYFRGSDVPALPTSVSTGDDVLRSQTISVREPVGDLREPPRRLEWIAVDKASRYRVRLMEVDRREVWSASTTATRLELPPDVRALSVPSKTLVWDVTAFDSSGAPIADSGPQTFRLVGR